MKSLPYFLLLILCLSPTIGWTKFDKKQVVILLNTVENGESLGSLEKLLKEAKEDNPETIQLVGLARKVPLEQSRYHLFQIVWTGLRYQKEKTKQVVFEKPMISTVKTAHKTLKKGQRLPIDGEPEDLLKALQQLRIGKTDKEALKRKRFTENPSTKGRFVEVDPAAVRHPKKSLVANNDKTEHLDKKSAEAKDVTVTGNPAEPSSQKTNHSAYPAQNASSFNNNGAQSLGAQFPRPQMAANAGVLPSHLAPAPLVGRELNPGVAPESAEDPIQPETTYEVTEEGCQPTVDRHHGRMIIQNRTRKRENGVIVEEGACADSLEMYPIEKDFLGEGCHDHVDIPAQKAYSRFKEYWLDKENQRRDLGNTLYSDLTRPYVFRDEPGNCLPSLDLQRSLAYRQVETLYYNLHNARIIVQECHPAPHQLAVPIIDTADRCPMIHDFLENISHEQKRSIFTLEGIEREALPCRPVGDPMRHEFDRTGCRPLTNLANGGFIDMVKRKIRTVAGVKIITEECEPARNNALEATREGCEGEYFHDLNGGRSYLKKRYFYPHHNAREYVTACIRTDESLPHQAEINGYEYDDQNLLSKPKFAIYIESPEQGRVVVDPAKVRGDMGQTHYTLVRNEHRPTTTHYYEGCYRRTRTQSINLYTRADGTAYERVIGVGNPIGWPVDECTRTTEQQSVVIGHRKGNFWRHGRAQYGTQTRVKITYPNGHVDYTGWQ